MRPHRLAALLLLVAVAGCSSSDAEPEPAPQTPPPAASAAADAGECADVADLVRDHVGADKVDKVTVVGQCTTVVIETGLSDSDVDQASELCNSAAEVAYVDDINSIRVLGAGGDELSQGITDLKCLP